jgi:hypothetical protein
VADFRQRFCTFLIEFIAIYESFSCVWRVKSKEYSDRNKEEEAYESSVEKFEEIDATASREIAVEKSNL